MTTAKQKYYVVWRGHSPGIYTSWEDCQRQTAGFPAAAYKAFKTEAEARQALADGVNAHIAQRTTKTTDDKAQPTPRLSSRSTSANPANPPSWRHDTVLPLPPAVNANALAVDAACSGNPGPMEYRGIDLRTGQEVFHFGPVHGTNNIGEFLAIVHALALIKQQGLSMSIYSDSRNALLWVKARKCRTKLQRTARTEQLFQLIERAERWLTQNDYSSTPLLKWQTKEWGEVPADFGRK